MASNNGNGLKRDEKGRNIQVVVRCRPFNTVERKSSHSVIDCDQSRREVTVKTGGPNDKASRKTYTFDMVFAPAAKQIDVYRSVVCPILDEVIMGYNCTVFAYGQTGTGKTFTMEGERSPDGEFTWEEDPLAGIIPRTLHQIFEKLSENGTEFSVKVSLLEIYNEELFDLLSPGDDANERLQLFDDPRNKRGVVVKGLEEITVHNKDEVYQILERGSAKRKTASTLMNAYSSRSHSVFSVTIHMKEITLDGEELLKIGKLNLVDLAGSENIGRSGAVDKRAREAGNINQSLLTLGRVITALVEKRPHIPYRESKLTRILQDSLGGRTKTSIIATVSPSSSNIEETLSTLEYASRAKNIMNKPEVNQKLTKRTLIKEYTEEIEKLKRDLAASRDKNGVYLSAENYESMVGQINTHEEQIAEYTEKITAMEEEIKKIIELFVDSKTKLEQCAVDLDQQQQRLEETSKHLEQTKEKLNQEELVCSELTVAHESLYNTAGQLLNTVDASTNDVSGLHDKLDRKKKVEQHNQQIQQSFAQRMEGAFNQIQLCVQQQGSRHQDMLGSYSQTIDGLVQKNEAALHSCLSTVETLVCGVGTVVSEGVSRCRDKVKEQESLCAHHREGLLQLLEEHQQDMEEVLVTRTLLSLTAVKELGDTLRSTVAAQRALANKVEAMKEMGVFFNTLVGDLSKLRERTVHGLSSLQQDHDELEEQISQAQEKHQTGMKQTIQCLQDQLNLLSMETEKDYSQLRSASRALQTPLQSLQDDMSSDCRSAEQQMSSQAELLSSTSSSLASSIRHNAEESHHALEEMMASCGSVHTAVSGLVERDLQWASKTMEHTKAKAQEQLTLLDGVSTEVLSLQQSVDVLCSDQRGSTAEQLSAHMQQVNGSLQALQRQTAEEGLAVELQQAELQQHVESSERLVRDFLQEELQQDVSTGATPQRCDFVYPRLLVKGRSRSELLNSLKREQESLQTALDEELEEEDDDGDDAQSLADQDSVEDETCNDSLATEPSFIDENLVFNESKRLPFFKKKKGSRKESKIPSQSKSAENESAPERLSRLPLRCQN
ncbi:kinesin-like protein KIF11 [Eucyclogobius newberryi]|uniref:kinesin-like protein KIF11 n=1 Tax=Eucyclogobius newberryi TaxID=166745 RepID=UPI003B5B0C3A